MKAKKILIISLILFAFVAVCVGLGIYFFAFPTVSEIPNQVELIKVDGKYQLVTQYHTKYSYKFKIEKYLGKDYDSPSDKDYIMLKEVNSADNFIELGTDEDFKVGECYRFSACYMNDNKSCGKYCTPFVWNISGQFEAQVDYEKFSFENETVSWEAVENAERYSVVVMQGAEKVAVETVSDTSFSCSELGLGQYKLFVSAGLDNPFVTFSDFGKGFDFKIERANVIEKVERSGNVLKVTCSQEVDEFQIYVDGALKLTLPAGKLENGVYTLNVASAQIDFSTQNVEICSSAFGFYVKESAKVKV